MWRQSNFWGFPLRQIVIYCKSWGRFLFKTGLLAVMIGYKTVQKNISAWFKSDWFHLSNKCKGFQIRFKLHYNCKCNVVNYSSCGQPLINTLFASQFHRHCNVKCLRKLDNKGKSQTCERTQTDAPHTTCHGMAEPLQLLGCEPSWQNADRQHCPISTQGCG